MSSLKLVGSKEALHLPREDESILATGRDESRAKPADGRAIATDVQFLLITLDPGVDEARWDR
jgi:hypothetical protein